MTRRTENTLDTLVIIASILTISRGVWNPFLPFSRLAIAIPVCIMLIILSTARIAKRNDRKENRFSRLLSKETAFETPAPDPINGEKEPLLFFWTGGGDRWMSRLDTAAGLFEAVVTRDGEGLWHASTTLDGRSIMVLETTSVNEAKNRSMDAVARELERISRNVFDS